MPSIWEYCSREHSTLSSSGERLSHTLCQKACPLPFGHGINEAVELAHRVALWWWSCHAAATASRLPYLQGLGEFSCKDVAVLRSWNDHCLAGLSWQLLSWHSFPWDDCLSGCLLLKQQGKSLLTFLMRMNFLFVPPYTANLYVKWHWWLHWWQCTLLPGLSR